MLVARHLRKRPSELIRGSLADLNIDVAMVMHAARKEERDFNRAARRDRTGWWSLISGALRSALESSR